ncbi:MAG TPA: sigma-70 family RNA polymerase sigma factor [Chloroflexota bacterium]|nr:sigma-70 family RNA polymerase sigma factor [Chloroflexota bacterium]
MATPEHPPLDRTEFEQVVVEYADRLYSIALRITGAPADAEDAVQEAFVNAYRHLGQYRGEAKPATWLYRITVNAALRRVRDRPPHEYLDELPETAEPREDWAARVRDPAVAAELRDQLERALQELAPDLRAAVILRDVENLSAREAAAALDIGEAALKSRLHRARVLLRQALADYLSG